MRVFFRCAIYIVDLIEMLPYRFKYFCLKKIHNIHKSFKFNGPRTRIYGDGALTIMESSYCGECCSFQLKKGTTLFIGKNCAISHNVRIYTANKDPRYIVKGTERSTIAADVILGDSVWVGANVFITQGVTIGNNVVIGANSVVTKSLPSHSVCAGNPCKVIKKYDE